MMQYYGAGVQACYRGRGCMIRKTTKATVVKVINWYKKYRDILNADIIHLRRADGRDWDGILHANPELSIKGLAMLYNPLKERITRTIRLPLYYTGLTTHAFVQEMAGSAKKYTLNRDYTIDLTVTIEPENYTWIIVK